MARKRPSRYRRQTSSSQTSLPAWGQTPTRGRDPAVLLLVRAAEQMRTINPSDSYDLFTMAHNLERLVAVENTQRQGGKK